MYHNDPMKVLTGEVRLAYVNVDIPQNSDRRYSVTLLIPKADTATKADIDASIQAAAHEYQGHSTGRTDLRTPLHDGDGVSPSGEPFGAEFRGCWVVTASTKTKPDIVHRDDIRTELDPSEVHSGMYGRVTLRFFGYGNNSVGCGLGNIMITRR